MKLIWKHGESERKLDEARQWIGRENALTIRAVVEAADGRAERMAALVSQWSPGPRWGEFAAFDAAGTDGIPSIGYFGAVFDGRYIYFSPEQRTLEKMHADVLRYDTHGDFKNPASYSAYDASLTSGLETRGYYGAAFDGRYVYFVPRQLDMLEYHTHVLRYDTRMEFKDSAAWKAHDAGEKHSSQGCAFDGRYLYFCPGFSGNPDLEDTHSAQVLRLDTQGNFEDPASYRSVDLSRFLSKGAACFDGGAFDGRYIYFVPIETTVVARYDTQMDLNDRAAWREFDAGTVGLGVSVGMVFDGHYLYCCAYAHGTIVRFDTRREFTDSKSWQSYRANETDGLQTVGFDGGFFDGRYVYFVPFVAPREGGGYTFHANFLRYDPQGDFLDSKNWSARDASQADGMRTTGYNAGAFDGRYFYAAPWQQGRAADGSLMVHAKVLRYDTLGNHGSFSLRYCDYGHNGGLCAAVMGPGFVVNTDRGARGVWAYRALPPGRHELVGRYDGREITLHIDGRLAGRREADGKLLKTEAPIVIGRIDQGLGRFEGEILEIELEG